MKTESDTPRTDALMPDQVYKRTMYEHILVMESHARQLERELNQVRKDLKRALYWIDDGVDQDGRDLIVNPMRAKYFADEN